MEQQNEDFWQLDRGTVFSSPDYLSPDYAAQQVQNQKLQMALEKRKMIEREINELSDLGLSPISPKMEINRPPMIQINGPSLENGNFQAQDNRSPYSNAPQNFGRVKTSKNMLQSYATAPQMNLPGFQVPPSHQQQMPYFTKAMPVTSPILSYQNQLQQSISFQDRPSPPFVQRQLSPGQHATSGGVMSPTQQSLTQSYHPQHHHTSPHVSFKFSPPFNDRPYVSGGQQALSGHQQQSHFQGQPQGQGRGGQSPGHGQGQQFFGPYDSHHQQQQFYNAPQQISHQNSYGSSSPHSSSSTLPSPASSISQSGSYQFSPPPPPHDGSGSLTSPPLYGNVYGNAQIQVQPQGQAGGGGQSGLYGGSGSGGGDLLNNGGGGVRGLVRINSQQRMLNASNNGSGSNLSILSPQQTHSLKLSPPSGHNSPSDRVPGTSPIVTPQVVYQVQFKHNFRDFVPGPRAPQGLLIGQIVIVQCQRGEDLGVVVDIVSLALFVERRYLAKLNGENEEEGTNVTHILRLASQFDLSLLTEKNRDESNVTEIANKVATTKYELPMTVVDAEYQFDRQKLTIFYTSDARIDFRELVKELFATFKVRVWMKKLTEKSGLQLKKYANLSLSTGVWCDPNKL